MNKKLISSMLIVGMVFCGLSTTIVKADTGGLQTKYGVVTSLTSATPQFTAADNLQAMKAKSTFLDYNVNTDVAITNVFGKKTIGDYKLNVGNTIYCYQTEGDSIDYNFVQVLSMKPVDNGGVERTFLETRIDTTGDRTGVRTWVDIEDYSQYATYLMGEQHLAYTNDKARNLVPVGTPGSLDPVTGRVAKTYTQKRIFGLDRIATSLAIANEYTTAKLDNVILTYAYNFPDALSGSVLAKKLNAPILLVGAPSENIAVMNYIKANLKSTGTVYTLGGAGVISDSVVQPLVDAGFTNFKRLGGQNRIETNLKIVNELQVPQGTPVVIVNEDSFPDALSISSFAAIKGYPILLSGRDNMDMNVINELKIINPSQIIIVGGIGAIGSAVESLLDTFDRNAVRIAGVDRFETSLYVANYFSPNTTSAVITSGYDFPDAISGSVLAAKLNAPIILVDSGDNGDLKTYLDGNKYNNLLFLGGAGAVSDATLASLTK